MFNKYSITSIQFTDMEANLASTNSEPTVPHRFLQCKAQNVRLWALTWRINPCYFYSPPYSGPFCLHDFLIDAISAFGSEVIQSGYASSKIRHFFIGDTGTLVTLRKHAVCHMLTSVQKLTYTKAFDKSQGGESHWYRGFDKNFHLRIEMYSKFRFIAGNVFDLSRNAMYRD